MSTDNKRHRNHGGCGYCRHLRGAKCRHPDIGVPVSYHQARGRGQPCGPKALLWQPYGQEQH